MDNALELAYFGRGLAADRLAAINGTLPDTRAFRVATLTLEPNFIATQCPPGSGLDRLPTAAICLQDTALSLSEARYAEAQASISLEIWRSPGASNRVGVAQAQYYSADATHRLYAAGEHLAEAILCLRGLEKSTLNAGRKDKAVSLQARVAKHLRAERPDDPITVAVVTLGEMEEWQRSAQYRGDSVHDQAPILEGIGNTFDRKVARWRPFYGTDGTLRGHQVSVGGGDPHETTADDVLSNAIAATNGLLEVAALVLDEYVATLQKIGVTVTLSAGRTSVTIFSPADDAPEEAETSGDSA